MSPTHTYGVSGIDGNRQLPPRQGQPVYYPRPPFSCDLAPTLRRKVIAVLPERLFVGLLTSPPDPDGAGYVALSSPSKDPAP